MTKLKITKREVLFFFLGVILVIIIDTVINWQDCKSSFMDGWNDARIEYKK